MTSPPKQCAQSTALSALPSEIAAFRPGSWKLFAFKRGDDHAADLRRERLPADGLAAAVEWAVAQGAETVLLELDDGEPAFHPDIVHHVCADPACPGGCGGADGQGQDNVARRSYLPRLPNGYLPPGPRLITGLCWSCRFPRK